MSWRYHGEYTPDPYNGRARGVCDRCGFVWQHSHLSFQYDYRGDTLTNTRFLVCQRCYDVPYEGRRPVRLPADPVPIMNPRVEPLLVDEAGGAPFVPPTPPTPGIPANSYITEDGSSYYVGE